ncbi:MAG: TonB-dependent receptor [Prevotellaceae bacterium]|nr:TonB-dependent receptor [Prevotellaceae bacterium]
MYVCIGLFLCATPVDLSAAAAPMDVQQQTTRITGTVSDAAGELLIGATVRERGNATSGTVTNLDGEYTLNVRAGATIEVSFIGYVTQSFTVQSGRSVYNVTLSEDAALLDEVVVIGYGVQKKKLLTGATVQVGGEELTKLNTTSPLSALQAQMPGVNILQSSGQPGSGFNVSIRGLGTVGSYSPLYVIDGVTGGDLNSLNPADIESIDVLKDASAGIYGSRAANGVILVTTKQGKAGKMQVTYDGSVAVSNAYKVPDLLNVQQFMQVMDELAFNQGNAAKNWASILGPKYESAMNGTWTGTDWMEEIQNKNALKTNHAFNVTGGSDRSTFSMGLSLTNEEGILGKKPVEANYTRVTARLNSSHVLWREGDMDVLKVGETLMYVHSENNGIATGNQYWNDIVGPLTTPPIMPVYDDEGNFFDYADAQAMGLTGFETSMANPIASTYYERGQNKSKNYSLRTSLHLELQPIRDLRLRTQFSYNYSGSSYRSWQEPYVLSSTSQRTESNVSHNMSNGWDWSWESTINYKFTLFGEHNFDALVGNTLNKGGMGENISGSNVNSLFNDFAHAWLANTKEITPGKTTLSSSPWGESRLVSFFGRVQYDWKETYLASVILRADGSSNFGRGHRWGYFPTATAGWVMTNESFMESATDWLDFLKLRGSWGSNGNQSVTPFMYIAPVAFDARGAYSFGNNVDAQQVGGYVTRLSTPDISWETQEQLDLGFDARLFNSRLSVAFDWYSRITRDWLVGAPIRGSYGSQNIVYINGGNITNKGFELALNWRDNIGKDWSYGTFLNLSYNTNKVTKIANAEGILHGDAHAFTQGVQEMYRAQVGYPVGYFWGFETAGLFQNQAEIDAWKAAGNGILQPAVQPGDVIFVDQDKNGVINDDDKVNLGSGHAKYSIGFGFNVGYKGFDLNVTTYGKMGVSIAKNYRRFADSQWQNYETSVFERWYGEGTSNKWPRLTAGSHPNYINFSDLWIEDGCYLKIQNVTLGYDFKKLFTSLPMQQLRLYMSANNLYTFTSYSGMDPEIGYTNGYMYGIDLGNYPLPRTFTLGVNVKF